MYIYILRSVLFQGLDQKRVVVTNFPVRDRELLERFVNHDNGYDPKKGWVLIEVNDGSK